MQLSGHLHVLVRLVKIYFPRLRLLANVARMELLIWVSKVWQCIEIEYGLGGWAEEWKRTNGEILTVS